MELTFVDRKLAETCNSRRLTTARWGGEGFERLAERLLQLSAVAGLEDVPLLPFATVELGADDTVRIVFDGGSVIVGGSLPHGRHEASGRALDNRLCIERVEIMKPGSKR
jgi:hypothetical protein